jgi:hypothetical protein
MAWSFDGFEERGGERWVLDVEVAVSQSGRVGDLVVPHVVAGDETRLTPVGDRDHVTCRHPVQHDERHEKPALARHRARTYPLRHG